MSISSQAVPVGHYLGSLDWFLFSASIFLTGLSIFWGQRVQRNAAKKENNGINGIKGKKGELSALELLVMGRRLTLPMFIASLVATWYGGIFGVTEISYHQGIFNFITQGFFWYLAYIFFALFLVRKIAPYKALTLPDLIGKMYGPKSRLLAAVFNFFNVLPIVYATSAALLLQALFSLSLESGLLMGLTIVVLYSAWGGLRSVVYSDLVQFTFMCLGVFLVASISYTKFGGLSYLQENLPPTHFSLTGGEGVLATLTWGLIAFATLVDPNFYQRCFAARDLKVAQKGILISTLIWFLFDICTTAGGMYARAYFSAEAPHLAGVHYLHYSLEILPPGARGLFLAGLVATIFSTMDSYLFIASSSIFFDMLSPSKQYNPKRHALGVIVSAGICFFVAREFQGNIKSVWKTLGSYSAACLLFPVLLSYLKPKLLSDREFLASSLFGVLATTYWRLGPKPPGFWANLDEIYIGFTATALIPFFKLALSNHSFYPKKQNFKILSFLRTKD